MSSAILALITFLTIFIYDGNVSVKELLDKGDKQYEKLQLKTALDFYLQAYKLSPENHDVLQKVTRTYNDIGEDFFESDKNDEAEKHINLAINYAEEFLKKYPQSPQANAYMAMSLGNAALFKGGKEKVKLAQKIKDYAEKSLRLDSSYYLPYVLLGIYHREISDLSWFERAFANTFFGKVPDGSIEESEKMFLKSLELVPDMVIALYQLSKTYRVMGKSEKERALLKKVMELPVRDFRDKYAKEKAARRLQKL